jgi:hypothetical protein
MRKVTVRNLDRADAVEPAYGGPERLPRPADPPKHRRSAVEHPLPESSRSSGATPVSTPIYDGLVRELSTGWPVVDPDPTY